MSLLAKVMNALVLGRPTDDPGPYDPGRVRKILVIRNDNIGDVLCTTPALDALRAAFPRAFIAALVCTLTEEALAGHRALDRLYVYPKAKHHHQGMGALASHWRLARVLGELRRERFDLAIAFRADFSTSQAWLAYASRARWRLGPEARGRKRRLGFYYNLPAPWPPADRHEVLRCFWLLGQIAVDSPEKRLYLKVPREGAASAFLAERGLAGREDLVVVNLARWAYRTDRAWPGERYRELVGRLMAAGRPVVVTHAPAEAAWAGEALAGLVPAPPRFCSPRLKEFAAVASRARVFVTAEGGPMHLAAAVGAPLVVLWGRTPRAVWHPWGVPYRMVGDGGPVAGITPDQVLAALAELAAEPAAPRGDAP